MKKNILIISLMFAVFTVDAQPYKPWSEYGTDTLNYIKYNFETRKSQYIGYTVEKIINDYELEMKDVTSIGPYVFADNKFYMKGIGISSVMPQETRRRWDTKSPMICFDIDFEPPYDDQWATLHYAPNFNTMRERALYVKDKIVKDIKVYIFQPSTPTPTSTPTPPPINPPVDLDPGDGGSKKPPRKLHPIDDEVLE